ncbi:MAG: hypothetical protein M3R64_05820 [Pseudomonadota bacterium]|nr:hypothetical protein [Pseudomonadota bacterium]
MNWGGPEFVLILIAISTVGWVVNNWIRARHGYAPSDDWGKPVSRDDPEAARKFALMASENDRLLGQVDRLQERLAVLERIATDPAQRTAREIEALR